MSGLIESKVHPFYSPTKILFGVGSASGVDEEIRLLGGRKPLIVTDPGVVKADLLDAVVKPLEASGLSFSVFSKVEPEPPARVVDEAADQFKRDACDSVIGVGGGSSLDVAKGVAVLATNQGSILDLCGMEQVKRKGVPKILMPTTAGTGSEVTRVLVITDESDNTKKVVYSIHTLADVAIVDPNLTLSMPKSVTADTGVDALVHAVETYVSANATPFSDVLAQSPIQWIAEYLPVAWAKGSNLTARYYMSLAATMAGLAFASGGLGAVHALAYPLGTEYHMPHGRSNAIMLPHVMKYNLSGSPEKYAAVAELMGKDVEGLSVREAAELAVEAVLELLEAIDISCRLRDYGIPEEDIPKLTEGGMKQSRLFVPNPRDLDEKDVRAIYEAAY
jgi:alcohol dehydrogenase class IV